MANRTLRALAKPRLRLVPAGMLVAAFMLFCISSCGGVQSQPTQGAAHSAPDLIEAANSAWAGLPPLPPDKLIVSSNVTLVQDGNDCGSRDAHGYTSDDGTFLSFNPPVGGLAWAMYSFYCGSNSCTRITVSPQPGSKAIYIGYSDYSSGRWVFDGPYNIPAQPNPAADIGIPLSAVKLSAAGSLHVVAAVFGSPAEAVIEQVQLEVSNWQDGQMNLAAQDGFDIALVEVAGRPAIAYVEESGKLKYLRASVADGSAWDAPITVLDGPFGTFRSLSLAVIAGRPAIAIQNPNAFGATLEFIRALDTSGSNWPTLTQIVADSSSDQYCGLSPSLAALDGVTAVAYRGENDVQAYAVSNSDATDPWFPLTVDASGHNAGFCSLRQVNGHPAICYIESGAGISDPDLLQYAYSTSLSGINSLDWEITTVDETNNAFGSGWLCFNWISDSYPAVVYHNGNGSRFKYAYASTRTGQETWFKQEVDPTVGSVAVGLVDDHGHPAIYYRDLTVTGFMRALDSTGTNWATPIDICPCSTGDSSVELIGSQPAIAYTANSNPSILAYTYRP